MKLFIVIFLTIVLSSCKSSREVSNKYTKEKDSISTNSEIYYVQKSIDYTSEIDLSKPFKKSFKSGNVTTTIEKDFTNTLKVSNTIEQDTVLTLRDRYDYFNALEVTDNQSDTIRYTPNKFNWTIPLILGAVIVLLIVGKKFDLIQLGTGLLKRIFKI